MIFTNKAPWIITGLFSSLIVGMELPEPNNELFISSDMSTTLWRRDQSTNFFMPSDSLAIYKDPFGIREYTGKAPINVLSSAGSVSLFSHKDKQIYVLGAVGLCALDQVTGRFAYTVSETASKSVGIFDTHYFNSVALEHAVLGLVWTHTSLVALQEKRLVRMDLDETGEPISDIAHTIQPIIPSSFSALHEGFFGGISSENKHIHFFSYDNASLVDIVVNVPQGCENGRLRSHDVDGSFLLSVCGKKKIVFFSAPGTGKQRSIPKVEFTFEAPTDETFVDCAIKEKELRLFATFTKDDGLRAGVRCWNLVDRKQPYAYWYLPNSAATQIFKDDTALIFSDGRSMSFMFSKVKPAKKRLAKKPKQEQGFPSEHSLL